MMYLSNNMRWFSTTCVFVTFLAATACSTVYYVAPTGKDTVGFGTVANPWATPRYACDHVAADQGHVIHIKAGTYYDLNHITVKTGVSLEGEGTGKTTLRNDNKDLYKGFLNFTSSSVLTDGNQYIRDLRICGMSNVAWSGIRIENRRHIRIINVRVDSCKQSGIEVATQGEDILIDSCFVNESSSENASASNGNIGLAGNLRDVTISNTNISHWGTTGMGIKALSAWKAVAKLDTIWNLKILNCSVMGKESAPWNNYMAPNISLEFNEVVLSKCEIAHCTVNNNISLVCFQKVAGEYSMWIHDNLIQPQASTCIEYGTDRVIMDHNFFDFSKIVTNPESGTKEFNKTGLVRDGILHHNVFYGYNSTVFAFSSTVRNLQFFNNTCIGNTGKASGFISLGNAIPSDSLIVKNNIIVSGLTGAQFVRVGPVGTIANHNVLTNNIIRHISVDPALGTISANDTVDPGLRMTGAMPSPFFTSLSATGPTVNRGVNVGYAYKGSAPDIGAYEYESATGASLPSLHLTNAYSRAETALMQRLTIDLAGRITSNGNERAARMPSRIYLVVNADKTRTWKMPW